MSLTTRTDDGWATTRFVVLGFGTAGYACADSLLQAGAEHVIVLDDRDTEPLREKAQILETLGAEHQARPRQYGGTARRTSRSSSPHRASRRTRRC